MPRADAPPSDVESPRPRLNAVEALRGVAALLVVCLHTMDILAEPNSFGRLAFGGFWRFGRSGVDFFFVLSGFIITLVHWDDIGRPATFGRFWRKRLLRIYPSWWIVAALFAALLYVSPTRDGSEREVGHALAGFFLLPEIQEPVLGVGWSLRHELLFYAVFSASLLHRRAGLVLLAAWAGGIVANMAGQLATGVPLFGGIADVLLFRGFNIEFFFGIAVAAVVRAGLGQAWRAASVLGALGFLATGMTETYLPEVMHEWPVRHLEYGASAALLLYGVAMRDRSGRIHTPRLLLRLGTASYAIYLLHLPVVLVGDFVLRFVRRLLPLPLELTFCLLVLAAAGAGIVFNETIEQRLLQRGRDRSRPYPPVQPRPCPEAKPLL